MDPDDRIDYRIDYAGNWRDSDEIESQDWFVESGVVTIDDMALSADGQEAIVWLVNGEPGYLVLTNRIQTALGRQIDTSIRVRVRHSYERPAV
jgi:hypothetical protein